MSGDAHGARAPFRGAQTHVDSLAPLSCPPDIYGETRQNGIDLPGPRATGNRVGRECLLSAQSQTQHGTIFSLRLGRHAVHSQGSPGSPHKVQTDSVSAAETQQQPACISVASPELPESHFPTCGDRLYATKCLMADTASVP